MDSSCRFSQLEAFLRDSPRGDEIWYCISSATDSSVFAGAHDVNADISDPDNISAFLVGALAYSNFPQFRCPQFADHLGIYSRMDAWTWVAKQIKEDVDDGDWLRADSQGSSADVFVRTFSMMRNCRFAPQPIWLVSGSIPRR